MTYKNFDYYERTFGTHAKLASTTKGKNFIPLYEYNPDKGKEFIPMKWPTYVEAFGAPSRNRT